MLKKLLILAVCIGLCNTTWTQSLLIDLENEIEQVEGYPIAVDTLEEFIQSYYTLLDSEEYLKGFSFIKRDKNVIPDSDTLLGDFLYKLMELRSGLRDRVTIYQIGDSHIKPGFFSTTARSSLIKYFEQSNSGNSPILSFQFTGIIGASYKNLLGNESIFRRCRELKPDLIVISLGTNDAQGTYNAQRFRSELLAFMKKLSTYQGEAEILFTLPPDTNKYGRHNADVPKVSAEIAAYAESNRHACWNLAEVMGGRGSIVKWRAQDFASSDLVHFSPKGYMLQGYLFYDALMQAYKSLTETSG